MGILPMSITGVSPVRNTNIVPATAALQLMGKMPMLLKSSGATPSEA